MRQYLSTIKHIQTIKKMEIEMAGAQIKDFQRKRIDSDLFLQLVDGEDKEIWGGKATQSYMYLGTYIPGRYLGTYLPTYTGKVYITTYKPATSGPATHESLYFHRRQPLSV